MNEKEIKKYVDDLKEVLEKYDVDALSDFVSKSKKFINPSFCDSFVSSSKEAKMITMWNMIAQRMDLSQELKDRAQKDYDAWKQLQKTKPECVELSEICNHAGYAFYKCINGNRYSFDWRKDKDGGSGYSVYCVNLDEIPDDAYGVSDDFNIFLLEEGKEYCLFFHVNEKGKIDRFGYDADAKEFDSISFLKDFSFQKGVYSKTIINDMIKEGPMRL